MGAAAAASLIGRMAIRAPDGADNVIIFGGYSGFSLQTTYVSLHTSLVCTQEEKLVRHDDEKEVEEEMLRMDTSLEGKAGLNLQKQKAIKTQIKI